MYPVKAIIFMILLEMHVLNIMKSYFPMQLLIKIDFLNSNSLVYATALKRLTVHVKLVEVIFFSRGTSAD